MSRFICLVFILSIGASMAHTQGTPNPADQLQREQERLEQLRKTQKSTDRSDEIKVSEDQKRELIPVEELCFPIDRVGFEPLSNERSSLHDFSWALEAVDFTASGEHDPALGRCLGIVGLQLIVRRTQNAIIEAGFTTTRVFLGPQNLATKELKLTLIPGYLREIRFSDAHANIHEGNALPRRDDGLLYLRDIEQGLENLKRVPTVEADFQIVPSRVADAVAGESDIEINWQQSKPYRFSLSIDDSGSEATGVYKGSFTFSVDNPAGLSDLFYVNFDKDLGGGLDGDRGTEAIALHYSLPLGYWQLSIDASKSAYHQTIVGATQNYVYSGESENANVKLSRIVHRDSVGKTSVSFSGWARASRNFIDDTEVEVQRRRTAGWELGLNHTRSINRATLDAGLTLRKGTGAFGALAAPEEAFGEGVSRPTILKVNLGYQSPVRFLGSEWNYSGRLTGQWSDTPLIAQDRFSIGSRHSIRGFSGESSLLGERGWTIRNDLSRRIGGTNHSAYVGLDLGAVYGPSTASLAGNELVGATLGLKGKLRGVNYNAYVAQAVHRPENFDKGGSVFDFSLNWNF